MTKVFLTMVLLSIPALGFGADERAKKDISGVPTILGVSQAGEIRLIKVTADGLLIFRSTGPTGALSDPLTVNFGGTSQPVDANITNAIIAVTDGGIPLLVEGPGWTTPAVSTVTVSTSAATLVLPSSANRATHFIANEGPGPIRIGPSSITKEVGLMVGSNTTINIDGESRLFRGNLYAIAAGTQSVKVSTLRGTP